MCVGLFQVALTLILYYRGNYLMMTCMLENLYVLQILIVSNTASKDAKLQYRTCNAYCNI